MQKCKKHNNLVSSSEKKESTQGTEIYKAAVWGLAQGKLEVNQIKDEPEKRLRVA